MVVFVCIVILKGKYLQACLQIASQLDPGKPIPTLFVHQLLVVIRVCSENLHMHTCATILAEIIVCELAGPGISMSIPSHISVDCLFIVFVGNFNVFPLRLSAGMTPAFLEF